jgi:hypothetical protein
VTFLAQEAHVASSKLPIIDEHLLDYIERMFPDRCPNIENDTKEVWFKAGSASVARHLRAVYEQQNENILENY